MDITARHRREVIISAAIKSGMKKTQRGWQAWTVDLEKFAELLVKECASLTLDHKSDDYYQGWLDYRDEILKHFGVNHES